MLIATSNGSAAQLDELLAWRASDPTPVARAERQSDHLRPRASRPVAIPISQSPSFSQETAPETPG